MLHYMNSLQVKLKNKLFDETIETIHEIINLYLTLPLNLKQDPTNKFYFSNTSWNRNDHSFTISTMTVNEHVQYLSIQLQCSSNILKFHKDGNFIDTKTFETPHIKINDVYKDITSEFNNNNNTHFIKVFALNVFPPHSFVTLFPSHSVQICLSYIIGISDKNILNLFFDSRQYFTNIYGSRGLQAQILEYNNNHQFKLTDVYHICENLSPIWGESSFIINDHVYKKSIPKINLPAVIQLVHTFN